jgi:hypothetical protein
MSTADPLVSISRLVNLGSWIRVTNIRALHLCRYHEVYQDLECV